MDNNDMVNMNPSNQREWTQFLVREIREMKDDQADDRETMANFIHRFDEWQKEHDDREKEFRESIAKYFEKVDTLEKRVNGWSALNSIGVIVAAILAALGLKGS